MTQVTQLKPAAERMRVHRLRRGRGLRCVTIELRDTEVGALVGKGFLHISAQDDPHAIREAIHNLLDRTLGPSL